MSASKCSCDTQDLIFMSDSFDAVLLIIMLYSYLMRGVKRRPLKCKINYVVSVQPCYKSCKVHNVLFIFQHIGLTDGPKQRRGRTRVVWTRFSVCVLMLES